MSELVQRPNSDVPLSHREYEEVLRRFIEKKSFRIIDIPLILYYEISRCLALGEETIHHSGFNSNWFRRVKLNPNLPATGKVITISVGSFLGAVTLKIWDVDFDEADEFNREYPLFRIITRIGSGGIWAYGMGNLRVESGEIRFTVGHIGINNRALTLVGLILIRLSQLVNNPGLSEPSRFWEAQSDPD